MILTSDMVSQSSVFADKYGPEKAIDKDRDTLAYTRCEDGKKVWYKIKFQGEHAVSEVVIIIFNFEDYLESRMDGVTVAVLSGDEEDVCGTLSVTSDYGKEKNSINCNNLRGDGVILRGEEGRFDACIHIREILVFETHNEGMLFLI